LSAHVCISKFGISERISKNRTDRILSFEPRIFDDKISAALVRISGRTDLLCFVKGEITGKEKVEKKVEVRNCLSDFYLFTF